MRDRELLAAAGADFALTVVDAGGAGGLHPRWRAFRPIVAGVLFDPREEASGSTKIERGRDAVLRAALGAADGAGTLHITRMGNMSSLLPPNAALLARFGKKPAHAEVIARESLRVRPLDDVAREFGFAADVVKADTQGAELEVLKGAAETLERSALFVEAEVSFLERYSGQPVFRDIEGFLASFGFELIDFHRLKRYRSANRSGIGNLGLGLGRRAGRIAYGDAFFLLKEDEAARRIERLDPAARARFTLKSLIILAVYGKADLAARWFDVFGAHLDDARKSAAARYLKRLGSRRLTTGHLHHVADYAARHV